MAYGEVKVCLSDQDRARLDKVIAELRETRDRLDRLEKFLYNAAANASEILHES